MVTMLTRDIAEGVYVEQIKERSLWPHGIPGGIAVVHNVGIDWTGEWMFQLRYLNQPEGTRGVEWGVTLREKDLGDFELIGNWISAQILLESYECPKKSRKKPPLSRPAWIRKGHLGRSCIAPNQLRLFGDF
jgi:hypothetical protein